MRVHTGPSSPMRRSGRLAAAVAATLAGTVLYAQADTGAASAAARTAPSAAAAVTATGAAEYFLKLDTILGESLDKAHRDTIEVMSWSWGAQNSGSASPGAGAGAGKVSFQDLSLTTNTSKASPPILAAMAKGQHLKSAVLYGRKAGGAGAAGDYLTITLTDVLVSSFQTSAAGDTSTDSFNLSFTKVVYSYRTQGPDGRLGPPVTSGWDLKGGRPV
jgi:type VI secretion system secreted protein Hcp